MLDTTSGNAALLHMLRQRLLKLAPRNAPARQCRGGRVEFISQFLDVYHFSLLGKPFAAYYTTIFDTVRRYSWVRVKSRPS